MGGVCPLAMTSHCIRTLVIPGIPITALGYIYIQIQDRQDELCSALAEARL